MLNTAEAARFLRVSQASIRRWSDSGLLASHRIGGRRERRFKESDLLEFMEHKASGPSREPGLNIGGMSVGVPTHVAPMYSSDSSGFRLSVPFLADGIRLGQPAFLVASGDLLDGYRKALDLQPGVDLASAESRGLFTVVNFLGRTASEAIAKWESYFARVLAKGPNTIRIVGEMSFDRTMFASDDEMFRYEEALEVMRRRYPVAVMCQYDVREFDGVSLLRALKAHPDMYLLRIGAFLI